MTSLATVVSREAAWFTAEPPATFTAAPPLIKASNGPFDLVQGYPDKITPRGKNLYITRERTTETRLSLGGEKEWLHFMLVTVLWSFTTSSGNLATEVQNLDNAVESVVTRIRGPFGDKTHGGAFATVAEGISGEERIDIDWGDSYSQLTAGSPLTVHIRYTATDVFVA